MMSHQTTSSGEAATSTSNVSKTTTAPISGCGISGGNVMGAF